MVGNMDNVLILKELMRKKQALFLEIERITNDMNKMPVEQVNDFLKKRREALDQAVITEECVREITAGDEFLQSVVNCTCDVSGLSPEMKGLYEEAVRCRSILNRIKKNEDITRLRIENRKDLLLEKIRTVNKSVNSVAENYRRAVRTGIPQRVVYKKNKMV